ncbi:MAG: AAA family ATPase [Calditrichota bacterium]
MPDPSKHPLPARIEQRINVQLSVAHRMRETPASVPHAPFVTISRQYGCQAMELAEVLAHRLAALERLPEDQWQVYSRKIIEDISGEVRLSGRILEALDVRARSGLEEFFQTLVGQAPPDIEVLHHLVQTVRALAMHGRCVLVGRGGAILTGGLPGGIHIRLVAPEPWRLRSLVNRFGWDENKARTFLRQEEDHRHSFFEKYLGRDVNDPGHYDLILNVARLHRDEQAEAVIGLFRQRFSHVA